MSAVVTKVRKVGNSLGMTLTKEVTVRLNIREGDELFVTDTPDGVQISSHDPDFAEGMAAYEESLREYRDVYRELAKR